MSNRNKRYIYYEAKILHKSPKSSLTVGIANNRRLAQLPSLPGTEDAKLDEMDFSVGLKANGTLRAGSWIYEGEYGKLSAQFSGSVFRMTLLESVQDRNSSVT